MFQSKCHTSFTPHENVIHFTFFERTSFSRRASISFDLWPETPAGTFSAFTPATSSPFITMFTYPAGRFPLAVIESPRKAILSPLPMITSAEADKAAARQTITASFFMFLCSLCYS